MQFHGGSVREFEENNTVKALLEMREQGLVKWIGASTNLPHLPTLIDWGVFDIFQLPYSALDRAHVASLRGRWVSCRLGVEWLAAGPRRD